MFSFFIELLESTFCTDWKLEPLKIKIINDINLLISNFIINSKAINNN